MWFCSITFSYAVSPARNSSVSKLGAGAPSIPAKRMPVPAVAEGVDLSCDSRRADEDAAHRPSGVGLENRLGHTRFLEEHLVVVRADLVVERPPIDPRRHALCRAHCATPRRVRDWT